MRWAVGGSVTGTSVIELKVALFSRFVMLAQRELALLQKSLVTLLCVCVFCVQS